MDKEQLLSFVRYQKGQKAGWDALDDILTAVSDSDRLVQEAEGRVKAAEERLAAINKEVEDKLAHAEARVSGVEQGIAEKKAAYMADIEKAAADAKAERERVYDEVAKMQGSIELLRLQANGMHGEIKILEAEREKAEKELSRVKAVLSDLSQSLLR